MRRVSEERTRLRFAAGVAGCGAFLFLVGLSACSIGNVSASPCTKNSECETAFGVGSECKDGYCSSVVNPGCNKTDDKGNACYSCAPANDQQFHNGCTTAQCSPFDKARLTKLNSDGSLPPLP